MEVRFTHFVRLVYKSKLPGLETCGARVYGSLVAVHWPTFWRAFAAQGLRTALLLGRDASWADARDAAGKPSTGTQADKAAESVAAALNVDIGAVRVYSAVGDAVLLLYPNRLPPPVRNLIEAVNEGHDPTRGVYRLRGGIVVVNWVVRASALSIDNGQWRVVAGSPASKALMPIGKRTTRLLAGTPWPAAIAATSIVYVNRLQRVVHQLERGRILRTPVVHRAMIIADDLATIPNIAATDVEAFRTEYPGGVPVRLALMGNGVRAVLPSIVTYPGGAIHSASEAQQLLRVHNPGKAPVVHAGHELAWNARGLRALAAAGGAPLTFLLSCASFLDRHADNPKAALPPPQATTSADDPPPIEGKKVRWTPDEDAVLQRFFMDESASRRLTTEEWEYVLGRLKPAHRDKPRARARVAYLRKTASVVAPDLSTP